jgi:hypothetical protein
MMRDKEKSFSISQIPEKKVTVVDTALPQLFQ